MENTNQIAVFEQKQIRRVEHEGEMWFSVIDIIEVLTDSKDPSDYWTTIKRRENQLPTVCRKFKFLAADGKMRLTDVADTEQLFRLIQSIPSPKAEPFKLWLAQVANERLDEMQDPELSIDRALEQYLKLGYSENWINQ